MIFKTFELNEIDLISCIQKFKLDLFKRAKDWKTILIFSINKTNMANILF